MQQEYNFIYNYSLQLQVTTITGRSLFIVVYSHRAFHLTNIITIFIEETGVGIIVIVITLHIAFEGSKEKIQRN